MSAMPPAPSFLRALAAVSVIACALPACSLTCNVRKSPLSPGDIAMAHNDFAKAESLYTDEIKSSPEADRLHAALIRAQLRQSKVADAEKNAVDWTAAQPKKPWAVVSVAEVDWREGNTDDAIKTLDKLSRMDYCNPFEHALLGNIYKMGAMYASANRELTLAHTLDPIDDEIEEEWMLLQPRAAQLQELTAYLQRSTFLTDKERKSLTDWKDRLSRPAGAGCHLATPVTSATIPFRGIKDGPESPTYWGLEVYFNGKMRRLEIDTGASGLVLTKSAANALHLEGESKIKSGGIGDEGDVDTTIANVKSIRIGNLEFQNCDVQILGADPRAMEAQDGLIGGDVFSKFILTLDFPGHQLKLDPLPPRPGDTSANSSLALDTGVSADIQAPQDSYRAPSMQNWDHIWRAGHDIIMPVRLNKPANPWRLFIVDTGAGMDSISPDAARTVAKVQKGSWSDIYGVSGQVKKTWTTGPMTLYFSHLAAPNGGMIAFDTTRMARSDGVEISGFIGSPTLHQLTLSIDYRDNLVHFTYDPSRLVRCVDSVNITNSSDCY